MCSNLNVPIRFAAPGRKEFVDYHTLVRTVEESFTQPDLERAPLIIPAQHIPSESNPRNFLNFDERHVVAVALDKLAALPDQNLGDIFKVSVTGFNVTKNPLPPNSLIITMNI